MRDAHADHRRISLGDQKYKPVYFMTHFNKTYEITPRRNWLDLLADGGIPIE
jgi:L-lysine 2,3-aminomutase